MKNTSEYTATDTEKKKKKKWSPVVTTPMHQTPSHKPNQGLIKDGRTY